jgi:O-acetyl-ADP-ribose deacetylase (regulator of RNase III)
MMIYHRTSILESTAQTVVNTVNCVGVMGKGIAADFKRRYPDMFKLYKAICNDHLLEPGKLWLWRGPHRWVLNFPTKQHWRHPSRLEWIDLGLRKFVDEYEKRGIVEISFPRLGCGNGGLDWDDVRPVMEAHLSRLAIPVYIHDYEVDIGMPEHLTRVADEASETWRLPESFEGFVGILRLVIERAGGEMADIESRRLFSARLLDNEDLALDTGSGSQVIDADGLRGVWLSLHRGLLTQHSLEGSAGQDASALISLLSLLPGVRPIQIQRPKTSAPEIALELRREPSSEPLDIHTHLAPAWA